MEHIGDFHEKPLTKVDLDTLFYELNKYLRKSMRRTPWDYKVDIYIVGGAYIVTTLETRESTTDVDAIWTAGDTMQDAINYVGDKYGLGHTWVNSDFKKSPSFTNAILYNCHIYREFDRLRVLMVNPDLALAMKLVAFREHKQSDMYDCVALIKTLQELGIYVTKDYMYSVVNNYFSVNMLSPRAVDFIEKWG